MTPSPKRNRVLAALPDSDYVRLLPDIEELAMPVGWAIHEQGSRMDYVYFPATSVVSLIYISEGVPTEIALVGNEGLVGITLFMGSDIAPSRTVVERAGVAYRLKAGVLNKERALGNRLAYLALLYSQALITHMSVTVACNRYHSIDQQLCRWLLMSLDRVPGNELTMSRELIASMLGTAGGSDAADKLQADGAIHCNRGHITILDRAKLEQGACECYAVAKKEFHRLLSRSERGGRRQS